MVGNWADETAVKMADLSAVASESVTVVQLAEGMAASMMAGWSVAWKVARMVGEMALKLATRSVI